VYSTYYNSISVYAIGNDGNLYTWYQASTGSGFSGPVELTSPSGASLTGTPAAVYDTYSNTISVYAKTGGGALYTWYQASTGSGFSGPVELTSPSGAGIYYSPAAVWDSNNYTISVYAVAGNGNLYTWYQASTNGSFGSPSELSPPSGVTFTGTPAAVWDSNNYTISVYAVSGNGGDNLYGWSQSTEGGSFGSPSELTSPSGVTFSYSPAVVWNPYYNSISVYAMGSNNNLYTWYQSSEGGSFSGPGELTPPSGDGFDYSPATVWDTYYNSISVFAVGDGGSPGNLYTWCQASTGSSFGSPTELTAPSGTLLNQFLNNG
jgi:hypothetical protein